MITPRYDTDQKSPPPPCGRPVPTTQRFRKSPHIRAQERQRLQKRQTAAFGIATARRTLSSRAEVCAAGTLTVEVNVICPFRNEMGLPQSPSGERRLNCL